MKLIALDSSGLVASVAVVEDEVLLGEYTIDYKKTHSQTLLPMLDELKKMIELDLDTVDAIAIAAGPGSFTGLRIGSATAKGLGLAMKKPIVEVPTLAGLAWNLWGTDKLVCPIMDARRNQVYTAAYAFVPEMEEVFEQCAMDVVELCEKLNGLGREVVLLGDGVPVYRSRLEEHLTVPHTYAPAGCNRQRAANIGAIGLEKMSRGEYVAAADHEPIYLRKSQAERELEEKKLEEKKA